MSTPYETAMRFMRQRGTTTGHPDFIVAYLREEASRTKSGNPLMLSPHPGDWSRAHLESLIQSVDVMKIAAGDLRAAFVDLGEAVARAGRQMRARPGRQFQNETSNQPYGRIG